MGSFSQQELQRAYRLGQRASLREGRGPGHAAAPAAEARLTRLLALAIGMFGAAVTAVISVGFWIA